MSRTCRHNSEAVQVSLPAKDRRFEVKEFRCGALVPGCWATFQGESDDEILRQVVVHAREEHGMAFAHEFLDLTDVPSDLPPRLSC